MRRSAIAQAVLSAAVMLPTMASAQAILQQRCNIDSLDPAQAEARLNWARRCALVLHVRNTAAGFDTGIPASNGGFLIDYAEDSTTNNWTGANRFTGQSDAFEVNNSFVTKLYLSGGTSQTIDGDGYRKWTRADTRKKARPLYPTFGNQYDINAATMLFPHPTLANCTLYLDRNGTQPATGHNFYINGYCEASCYAPGEEVLFSDGYSPIEEAVKTLREDVVTLTADSTLDDIKLQQNRTYSYTAEFRDSEHPIIEIRTASGGHLRVTTEHPMVNGEGRLVQAQTMKAGDALLKVDGSTDPIVSVEKSTYFGKVYNLRPATSDLVTNILVAEGYLVGSSTFQNDDVGYINRIILHKSIPAALVP